MIKEDRATRWTNLLKIDKHSMSKLSALAPDYKLDHKDQAIIHSDCQDIQNQLPMFEENELRVYLELLLTYYCKTKKVNYTSGMHEVLAAFFLLGFSGIKTVYSAFDIFVKKMMPGVFTDPSTLDPTFKIFHHLLMYHEPLLCSRLDGKMISASVYGQKWFSTLFASSLNISLLLAFWEFCLQEQNPTLPYFFALVYMGKIKEKVLNKKNLSVNDLDLFEFFIDELEELDDLCQEALSLQHQTPTSFVTLIEKIILCKEPLNEQSQDLINSVALTILPSDALVPKTGRFIVDLRSYSVYSVGHYPQTFNLPTSLKLSTGID